MNVSFYKRVFRTGLLLFAFLIVSLILWNAHIFFKQFKQEERLKMEVWATAQLALIQSSVEQELGNLPLKVLANNTSTPMVLVNAEGSFKTHNLPLEKATDSAYIQQKIRQFKHENAPIQILQEGVLLETLYYGNSEVLNQLKYYPLALLLILFLFGTVIFLFVRVNKASEQNKLWAGMAKETAHQIGTPLSSLLGWSALLKTEKVYPEITKEIDKDVDRLQTITERFSKIGAIPVLEVHNIVAETEKAYQYVKRRSSKLLHFSFHTTLTAIPVLLNPPLYHWSIENLIKNGIDATKGKGAIALSIEKKGQTVYISVSDTGHGIAKRDFQRIFKPGVTSKRRGWGLGLSLVKRIVEVYHRGKVKVLSSAKTGTVMQLSLKIHGKEIMENGA